ncbi:MAG: dihydropyrimidinase [Candidatus Dormibacteraeota bacterium]|nr:dihydropyrimidinase [Candidatus Dormibacteraeota bacterium]
MRASGARTADVLIKGERIASVGPSLPADSETVIDATGMLVMPGVVDPHTHFVLDTGTEKTLDDFASASVAAAAGGVTTFLDFAPQQHGQSFQAALDSRLQQIDGRSLIDYGVHLNITDLLPGWERDLDSLVETGVTSAKVYTTYRDTVFYVDDWTWYRLMERAGQAGLLVQVHAENDAIVEGKTRELIAAGKTSLAYHAVARPAVAEAEAVARGLLFSRASGSPVYFVHLSTPLAVDLVREARPGVRAIAETCPHYLVLDDSVYAGADAARYLMTPPLRDPASQSGLWERLRDGGIDAIGSDHCGFGLGGREGVDDFSKVSGGIPGVETTLLLLYTFGVRQGRIDLPDLVRLLCANPAKIFGLWGRKGDLAAGFDADLVILDPRPERILSQRELHSRAGYSPYEGLTVQGRVRTTISRGQVIYQDGQVLARQGRGQFLKCQPFDRSIDLR